MCTLEQQNVEQKHHLISHFMLFLFRLGLHGHNPQLARFFFVLQLMTYAACCNNRTHSKPQHATTLRQTKRCCSTRCVSSWQGVSSQLGWRSPSWWHNICKKNDRPEKAVRHCDRKSDEENAKGDLAETTKGFHPAIFFCKTHSRPHKKCSDCGGEFINSKECVDCTEKTQNDGPHSIGERVAIQFVGEIVQERVWGVVLGWSLLMSMECSNWRDLMARNWNPLPRMVSTWWWGWEKEG